LRDADTIGFVFPVRLCRFHVGRLNPSAEENAPKWNLVRSDFTNLPTVFGEQIPFQGIAEKIPGLLCMASVDEYRDYAVQCMALASESSNRGDKARLLEMAQAWHDLAEKHDANQNKSAGKDQGMSIR
jgi:hypothetical protein